MSLRVVAVVAGVILVGIRSSIAEPVRELVPVIATFLIVYGAMSASAYVSWVLKARGLSRTKKRASRPRSSKDEQSMRRLTIASCVALFTALVFMIIEIGPLDNTIGGLELFWIGVFTGVAVATPALLVLFLRTPSLRNATGSGSCAFGLIMSSGLFCAALLGYLNRAFALPGRSARAYQVEEKAMSSSRRAPEALLFIRVGDHQERIAVDDDFWDGIRDGEFVELTLRRGLFGQPIVIGWRHAAP